MHRFMQLIHIVGLPSYIDSCNEFILLDYHPTSMGLTLCKGDGASLQCSFRDVGEPGKMVGELVLCAFYCETSE